MSIPKSNHARLYYRCALKRFEEARILRKADQTTGAVYLAGYGIECMLKALILNVLPDARQGEMLREFRGGQAHDYHWLRKKHLQNGGTQIPNDLKHGFTLVYAWSTELRYVPKTIKDTEADAFLRIAQDFFHWADGRL